MSKRGERGKKDFHIFAEGLPLLQIKYGIRYDQDSVSACYTSVSVEVETIIVANYSARSTIPTP